MDTDSQQSQGYLTLLQLEKEARHAESEDALAYTMVNRARVLVAHRQAILFHQSASGKFSVKAISDVPTLDSNAPFVRWLTCAADVICSGENANTLHEVDHQSLSDCEGDRSLDWLPRHLMWCPLKTPGKPVEAALLIARDESWQEADSVLMAHVTDAWGHAWGAITAPRKQRQWTIGKTWPVRIVLAAILLVQFFPVSQTALAPAEVVAHRPELVAAPMDGVIKTVHVKPNSPVKQGELLFSYDDTSLSGRLDVAEEELHIALTTLRTAQQGAFNDPKRNAEVALLSARVALSEAERDYIRDQVSRKDVRAGREGVAVFRHASDLEGRPITTGERVMLIAQPHGTELRIELPVSDAVVLEPGAPVRLFLDRAPLDPVDAILEHAAYEAEVTPSGVLSYRLLAKFTADTPPRIGLRGTAKVTGKNVPLFLYLFRRPISALRQWLGI
jgi:hypothetical protein